MKNVLKRMLAAVITLVMVFSFIPWNKMKAFASFDNTVYAPVLNEYKEITTIYNNGDREAVFDFLETSKYIDDAAGVMFCQSISYRDDCSFLYALYDIDNNGIDEFVVGFKDCRYKTWTDIISIYTYSNGKITTVSSATAERYTLSVFKNGIVIESGTGGARTYGWTIYKFYPSGAGLQEKYVLETEEQTDGSKKYYKINGSTHITLTEGDFLAIFKQYAGTEDYAKIDRQDFIGYKIQFDWHDIIENNTDWESVINEHIDYYNANHRFWSNNGFNRNIDSDKLKSNATALRIWDSIKDAGEVASFKFDKLQIEADYYDAYLADMLLAFSESSAAEEIKFKAGEYYSFGFGKISTFLKSSKEYNKLSESFNIESAFASDYDMSESMKETFSKVFKDAYKNHPDLFRDIYQGFDCANEICKDINTGLDAFNTFRDCYNAYCVSRATKEVCSEFFALCYDAADEINKTNSKFCGWFKKNIKKFENNAQSDADLYTATKTAWKAGYLVYDTFLKDVVKDAAYNWVATTFGVAAGEVASVIAAWNVGTALGDLIAGKDTESAYYMYYISPVEGAIQTVLTRYGEALKSKKTLDNANKYEIAFTTLKYTNIALYNKAFTFASKHRILWIKTKSMKENMETATYYKSKWTNYFCHKTAYEELNNYNTVGVHCPVDVYLYKNNELVVSIVNEEIKTYVDSRIAVTVCDEQKGICYPSDKDYRIEIIARSNGVMDYHVMSIQNDSVREIEINDIPLATKQKFMGSIPQNHNAQTDQFELKTNGKTISADYDSFNIVHSVSVSDVKINYKKSATIKPNVTADEGITYTVKYESSNPKVATVDENGKVYGAKKGTADIKVTVTDQNGNTVTDTCKVTVKYSFGQWLIVILLFGWIWY